MNILPDKNIQQISQMSSRRSSDNNPLGKRLSGFGIPGNSEMGAALI